MALIDCSECKAQISDKAQQCPKCGCPIPVRIQCNECGNSVLADAETCTECGCPIHTAATPVPLEAHTEDKAIPQPQAVITNAVNTPKPKVRKGFLVFMCVIVVVVIGTALSCHIEAQSLTIFPKEHLSFSNTFIDVQNYIDKYNNAGASRRAEIEKQHIFQQLKKNGLIVEKTSSHSSSSRPRNNNQRPRTWSEIVFGITEGFVSKNESVFAGNIQKITHPTGMAPRFETSRIIKQSESTIEIYMTISWEGGISTSRYQTQVAWTISKTGHISARVTSDNAKFKVSSKREQMLNNYFRDDVYPIWRQSIGD